MINFLIQSFEKFDFKNYETCKGILKVHLFFLERKIVNIDEIEKLLIYMPLNFFFC